MKLQPATPGRRSSFTLVEMLVSMVVLSILLLVLFSILRSTSVLSDSAYRDAEAGIEAKEVLDLIGADVSAMIARPDVDQFYFQGNPAAGGNDKMFYYTQQSGFYDSSVSTTYETPTCLVGYRVNTSDNPLGQPTLERLALGQIWDNASSRVSGGTLDSGGVNGPQVYLTFPSRAVSGSTAAINPVVANAGAITNQWSTQVGTPAGNFDDGTSPFYSTVGSQTFRFQVCFQLRGGSYSLYPGYTNSAPVYPSGITNAVGVVVAIAVLDSASRKLVPASSWSKLIAALPSPTAQNLQTNALMDAVWNSALQQPGFASATSVPPLVAQNIRVYQRYYYLNVPYSQ